MKPCLLLALPLLFTMGQASADAPAAEPGDGVDATAHAQLQPTRGNQTRGSVRFVQTAGGVQVTAEVSKLSPGKHGFHVHEQGDCSDPEAKSAGGHFNPGGHAHGAPDAMSRHAGDLGNLQAGADGRASLDALFPGIRLTGPNGLMGRGLIVHAAEDDLSTQPTGNAGARLACGVIKAGDAP